MDERTNNTQLITRKSKVVFGIAGIALAGYLGLCGVNQVISNRQCKKDDALSVRKAEGMFSSIEYIQHLNDTAKMAWGEEVRVSDAWFMRNPHYEKEFTGATYTNKGHFEYAAGHDTWISYDDKVDEIVVDRWNKKLKLQRDTDYAQYKDEFDAADKVLLEARVRFASSMK